MHLISKKGNTLRVVIVGGGYAGLAALVTLREQSKQTDITLIDPRPAHVKVTQVHESFRKPNDAFKLPFHLIENGLMSGTSRVISLFLSMNCG